MRQSDVFLTTVEHHALSCGARCPECGYSLTGQIQRGLRRCPECGSQFTLEQLLDAGEQALSPHESRIPGPLLLVCIAGALAAAFVILSKI